MSWPSAGAVDAADAVSEVSVVSGAAVSVSAAVSAADPPQPASIMTASEANTKDFSDFTFLFPVVHHGASHAWAALSFAVRRPDPGF
jgi:hypothetical protein